MYTQAKWLHRSTPKRKASKADGGLPLAKAAQVPPKPPPRVRSVWDAECCRSCGRLKPEPAPRSCGGCGFIYSTERPTAVARRESALAELRTAHEERMAAQETQAVERL